MAYVDGFVLAVPKANIDRYKEMTRKCEPIWREFGAIEYVECLGDDTPYGEVTSFPRSVQAKEDEVVILSWIVYPSKEVRQAANDKIMKDPRLKEMMEANIFDGKRMIFGGFVPFIGL